MSNSNSNITEFIFNAARDAYATLRRGKGLRATSVIEFLNTSNNDERDLVIEEWGSDYIRRGLREAAIMFERKNDEETANVFWLLRDSIDMGRGGFLDFGDVPEQGGASEVESSEDTVVEGHHYKVVVHDNDEFNIRVEPVDA